VTCIDVTAKTYSNVVIDGGHYSTNLTARVPSVISAGLSDRCRTRSVAIEQGHTNFDLRNLPVEVKCREKLARQFLASNPLTERVMRSMIPRGMVSM